MTQYSLGRFVEFDHRSLAHPIKPLLPTVPPPRSYTWSCQRTLDQFADGACTGFAWAHELIAKPGVTKEVTNEDAKKIYHRARELDQWPGEDYEGSSVIAAAKATVEYYPDKIKAFKWAFGLDEVIQTLGYYGPVVLGINWHQGMFEPDSSGYIHATGPIMGGHAILARGVYVKLEAVKLHNSWGPDWGNNGSCMISFKDLKKLLKANGEACVPVRK